MMLYVRDYYWQGALVVVAESREHACQLVQDTAGGTIAPEDWDEYKLGEVVTTWGDQ